MDLSIVLPVYKAESYIEESARLIHSYMSALPDTRSEIIFVDDGSPDATRAILERLNLPGVKIISLASNQGKFAAIKAGMKIASGRCRIFTDGDVPYELEAIPHIARLVLERQFHVVVGDRHLFGSEYVDKIGCIRKQLTRVFSFCVRATVSGGLFDTQCGLKAFRGDVAEALFPILRDSGFSGDVELLYICMKYNLEIKRIPVRLRRNAPSTVNVMSHGARMVRRISRLRRSWERGYYESPLLRAVADQSYWQSQDSRLRKCSSTRSGARGLEQSGCL